MKTIEVSNKLNMFNSEFTKIEFFEDGSIIMYKSNTWQKEKKIIRLSKKEVQAIVDGTTL